VLLGLIGCWLGLNVLVGVYLVLAAREKSPAGPVDRRRDVTVALLAILLVGAFGWIAVSNQEQAWSSLSLLGVLMMMALASDALPLTTSIFRISGSFLAIVLAAALLGPAPAAVIGIACTLVDGIRRRSKPLNLLINLFAFTVVPLALGAGLQWLDLQGQDAGFAAAVVVAALIADLANFVLVGVPMCWVLRRPFGPLLEDSWLPVLPWQLLTAAILGATVIAEAAFGPAAVAVAAVSLVAFQLVARSIVERRQRGGQLPLRPDGA
jgi:hypothetical protein